MEALHSRNNPHNPTDRPCGRRSTIRKPARPNNKTTEAAYGSAGTPPAGHRCRPAPQRTVSVRSPVLPTNRHPVPYGRLTISATLRSTPNDRATYDCCTKAFRRSATPVRIPPPWRHRQTSEAGANAPRETGISHCPSNTGKRPDRMQPLLYPTPGWLPSRCRRPESIRNPERPIAASACTRN